MASTLLPKSINSSAVRLSFTLEQWMAQIPSYRLIIKKLVTATDKMLK